MRRSQLARRRFEKKKRIAAAIDALENRRLFTGETVTQIGPQLSSTNPSITLDQYFTDSTIPGTLATFKTNLGTITVALTDQATPLTVANFLSYIDKGEYTDTIFHRSALLTSNGGGGSPTTQADIIQGGGYVLNGKTISHIPTTTAVDDEYTKESFGDIAGTLAMAKTSLANSATSEWYFNVHDNVSALDTPTTDSNGVTTSYTVFGKVLTGMNVVDEIASLPTYNVSSALSLTTVPVTGLTEGEATKLFPITANNLVYVDSITAEPGTHYTVTSSNNALVTPKVTDGVLSFTYATGLYGTAQITVVGKNLDGTSASTTFTVTVPNSATPSAGPTTAAYTAPDVVTGTTTNLDVLGNDTDSISALDPSTVTITTQPAHGTAIANTSTGLIAYTPAAGYTGSDSFAYTINDSSGTVSSPATVSLSVVSAPVSVTIGTAKARSLTFTQPGGSVGHLTVKGGTAVVTFSVGTVTTSTSGDVITATGTGATLSSVVITNTAGAASLTLASTGAITLGSVTDAKAVSFIDAPNATLSGASSFLSIGKITAAAATGADLSIGSNASTALIIPQVTDTSVTTIGGISSITSTQWVNDDGGFYAVTATRIGKLVVTGGFADQLSLSSTGDALASAAVGAVSAAWTTPGSVGRAIIGTPASTWSLTANGSIASLAVHGNLANSITAAEIGALSVTGTTTGATLQVGTAITTAREIGRLTFGGQVSSSTITALGTIGPVTAPSISSTTLSGDIIASLLVSGASTGATIKTDDGKAAKLQIGKLILGGTATSDTITSDGRIGPITAGSLSGTQITGDTLASITATGAVNTATISTTNTDVGKISVGAVRIGGTFNGSSVSTAGTIAAVRAASLSSASFTAGAIGTLAVTGATSSSTITANEDFAKSKLAIGRLTLGGAVTSTTVTSTGNVGDITAASLTGSHIYAGVSATTSQSLELPSSGTEFEADAKIASVTLGKESSAFSNTLISAETLGSLRLGDIATSNGGLPEGVAAERLSTVSGVLSPGGTLKAGKAQLKSTAALTNYESAAKLSPGDFEINIL